MKESYKEGDAHHFDPESCLDDPRGRGEALRKIKGSDTFVWKILVFVAINADYSSLLKNNY